MRVGCVVYPNPAHIFIVAYNDLPASGTGIIVAINRSSLSSRAWGTIDVLWDTGELFAFVPEDHFIPAFGPGPDPSLDSTGDLV